MSSHQDSLRLQECGRSRRSGLAAAPTAAVDTRLSRSVRRRMRRGAPRRACYALGAARLRAVLGHRDRTARSTVDGDPTSSIAYSAEACAASLVLIGGEPGIGKSTLLLQAAAIWPHASGRFSTAPRGSEHQIKSRGERLAVGKAPLYLRLKPASSGSSRKIAPSGRRSSSSIHSDGVFPEVSSAPAASARSAKAATRSCSRRKARHPHVLVGHVTKDGSLAGPKPRTRRRLRPVLRRRTSSLASRGPCVKNRFGAITSVGVFG